MYIPRHFRPPNLDWVAPFVLKNGFAQLVATIDNRPFAVHIPLYIDTVQNVLFGHVARANPIAQSFDTSCEALAIFMHQHAYVSSSWYEKINVPTWNYVAVHISGTLSKIEGPELYESIEQLVDQYEDVRPKRFHMSNMSEQELAANFRGLIGFKMKITAIEGKYKLSQNRNDRDYKEIIRQLQKSEDPLEKLIADDMLAIRPIS